MLNKISRKYFKRAFAMSGSLFSYFALTEGDHVNRIKECFNINEHYSLIEFLKTSASEILTQCHFTKDWGKTLKPKWTPTIEVSTAENAFLTQSPDEIYDSAEAPVIDSLFSFTTQVFYEKCSHWILIVETNRIRALTKIILIQGTNCIRSRIDNEIRSANSISMESIDNSTTV